MKADFSRKSQYSAKMDVKLALQKIEESSVFTKWKNANKKSCFSYAFKITQEMEKDDWQIGFYNKKRDKITTFVLEKGAVKMRPEEEIFKKEETEVNCIKVDDLKLNFDEILSKAEEFSQKEYPKDQSIKTIAILQNANKLGNIWNITYITGSFNTLNIKLSATDGSVLSHNLASVFSFKQSES